MAQFAVTGGVEEAEVARAFVGWVAWGTVVRGCGGVGAWEQGGDAQGGRRCVCLGRGTPFSL